MQKCVCICQPNDSFGLEGQEYDCEAIKENGDTSRYRIWPIGFLAGYYVVFSGREFEKHFKLIDQ